jgi:hypothetical protein
MARRVSMTLALSLLLAARMQGVHAANCEELVTSLQLADTSISLAESVAPGAFKPPGPPGPGVPAARFGTLPAFCRIAGTIKPTPDSDIRFEVWMPATGWNGKFVGVGNGVWAGAISYFEMVAPLTRGYATAATDDGHQGNALDASFAAGHPEKLIDFGYRGPHEMTRVAKATIAAYYGKPASRALFASCSTGGRQGLMEAYRYPHDYEVISSMAPANPMVPLMVSSLWTGYAAMKNEASRLTPVQLALAHKAAIAACDADDGVKDGIISAPERCHFDPSVLLCKAGTETDCLTAAQVEALRAIYKGPRDPRKGKAIFAGFEPGSEIQVAIQAAGPQPFGAAVSFMRDLVFKDPSWDFRSLDYGKDVDRARETASAILDVPATGLDAFFAQGGKLLLSHGWADGLIPPGNTVEFYTALAGRLGARKSEQSVRLFMIPGMTHCSGGEGPFVVDVLSTIDSWAETGHAPERIIASNPPGASARTRPLCPYPQQAAYSGSGSTDEEQSFHCTKSGR